MPYTSVEVVRGMKYVPKMCLELKEKFFFRLVFLYVHQSVERDYFSKRWTHKSGRPDPPKILPVYSYKQRTNNLRVIVCF